MPVRNAAVEPGTNPKRQATALRAAADLSAFRERLNLPDTPESLLLYLTHLLSTGASGHVLRKRVQQLDAARRLGGNQPWTTDPDVRLLLRGLHQVAPLTNTARGHPLYRELVLAMVDAIMLPSHDQRRWRAAILLTNETGASARSIASLRWSDVRFRGNEMSVRWRDDAAIRKGYAQTVTHDASPMAFEAMRDLWTQAPDRSGAVFASRWGICDYQQVWASCRELPAYSAHLRRRPRLTDAELDPLVRRAADPTHKQLRDRALVLVGYTGALRTREATTAAVGWFRTDTRGLLLDVPLRREVTAVPASGDAYCPVTAWTEWLARLRLLDRGGDGEPAFPQMYQREPGIDPLGPTGLNTLVSERSAAAGLEDDHKFTNLRDGWIRDAIRAGATSQEVAAHADMRSLGGVARHERRENLLRDNVAARLGL